MANASDNLTLGIHPYLAQAEIIDKFTPLANYLRKETGLNITVKVGSNYQEHIQYIGTDKIDIAYMGPASYVELENTFGKKPLLAKLEVNGQSYFQGNIITRKDANIANLKDLKGKQIAFGDPSSTMSYIVPHYMLHKAGVFTNSKEKHQFFHSHNNVAFAVLTGDFDAGAVKPAVFKKFETKGLITLAMTPKISEHLFVSRANLPKQQINLLRSAMLKMRNKPEGQHALRQIKKTITGLVSAKDSDYANLRNIINETRDLHK